MSLGKIFGLYTVCFLGVTILIGLAEQFLGLSPQWIGWIFMGLSLGIYIVIGIITRTSNPDQYYVAGRGVPAVYNGMATGSDWMSAASFHIDGRRAFRPRIRRSCIRDGLDRRLSFARRLPRSLPSSIRRLHDSRLPWRPLRWQPCAHHRRRRRHRLLFYVS